MIEAHAFTDVRSLSGALVRRERRATIIRPPSRALVTMPPAMPASGWPVDLRFYALCYLAGFVFFLIMLS